jgi:hypothetical protein
MLHGLIPGYIAKLCVLTIRFQERFNLFDPEFIIAAFDGFTPYGYSAGNKVVTPQPWVPENIILVSFSDFPEKVRGGPQKIY